MRMSGKSKKLRLSSETLCHLANPTLGQAVGGTATNGAGCTNATLCYSGCNNTCLPGCYQSQGDCGSRLC